MNYDPKIAKSLIKTHRVTPFTVFRWEQQGYIPEYYFLKSKLLVQGYYLSEARLLCELNQTEVADGINALHKKQFGLIGKVSFQQLSGWERGRSKPNSVYEKLFNLFYADEFKKRNISPKPTNPALSVKKSEGAKPVQ